MGKVFTDSKKYYEWKIMDFDKVRPPHDEETSQEHCTIQRDIYNVQRDLIVIVATLDAGDLILLAPTRDAIFLPVELTEVQKSSQGQNLAPWHRENLDTRSMCSENPHSS